MGFTTKGTKNTKRNQSCRPALPFVFFVPFVAKPMKVSGPPFEKDPCREGAAGAVDRAVPILTKRPGVLVDQ